MTHQEKANELINTYGKELAQTPKDIIKKDVEYVDNLCGNTYQYKNKDKYKDYTPTNLQLGLINPPKYGCDTLLRAKIVNSLKRAEIKIKRYQPEYWMPEHIKDELLKELFNELK